MTKHENQLGAIETLKSRVNIRDMVDNQSLTVHDLKDMANRLTQVIGEIENQALLDDVQAAITSLLKLGVSIPKELSEKEAFLIKNYFPETTPKGNVKGNTPKKDGVRNNKSGVFEYKGMRAKGKTVGRLGGEVQGIYDLWLIDNPTGDRKAFNEACFKEEA
ncbi:hypothetical protein O1C12_003426 [Vibrio cholerae]|nr:hypothetical protein [Vibrio cholerae]